MGNQLYWLLAAAVFGVVCTAYYAWLCRPKHLRWLKMGVWWTCYVAAAMILYHYVAKVFYN